VAQPSLLEEIELSPRTKRLYDGHVRRFETFLAGKEVSEEGVLAYLDQLDKRGLSRNYIRTVYKVLKANVPAWPIQRRLKFRVNEKNINRPVLPLEQQKKMLAWTRSVNDVEGEAFLAVSSIYGVRCEEIAQISSADLLDGAQRLIIHTKKGGETREHLVPDEIRPSLLKHIFRPVSERYASAKFRRMYLNSIPESDHQLRTGWHAIRRALVTELIRAKLDFNVIGSFLRWKMAADVFDIPRMIAVYDQRPFEEVDRAAFAVHPFLELWR
jgi:hypothetical protein